MHASSTLIWLAVALLVLWIILRVALAMTGAFLHLLWIGAIIVFAIWLFRNLTGHGTPHA